MGSRSSSREQKHVDEMDSDEEKIDAWRFIVLIAAFLIMVSLKFPITSFGVMYSRLLMNSNVPTMTVSWIYNLSQFSLDTVAIFVGPLCEAFGWRKVSFTAGFVFAFSTVVSGFIENPLFLFITFSIFTGMSIGVLIALCSFMVPVYFVQGRGIAMGIQYAGLSIGDFVTPPIVYYLQQNYGQRSALFILGAILFNICAASLVFHPIEWHKKKKCQAAPLESTKKDGTTTETEIEGGKADCNDFQKESLNETLEKTPQGIHRSKILQTLGNIRDSTVESLKMLIYFRVWILSASSCMIIVSLIEFLMLIPFALESRNIPMDTIVWCLSTVGISNLISRLIITSLTDILHFSAKWYFMVGILAASAGIIGFGFARSIVWIYVCMAFFGVGIGVCLPLIALVIIEFMGIDLLPRVFGVNGLFNALGFMILAPTIGYIRDATGDYELTIQLLSMPLLLCFLAWCLMPLAVRMDARRERKECLHTSL